jgi:hypothetical protein
MLASGRAARPSDAAVRVRRRMRSSSSCSMWSWASAGASAGRSTPPAARTGSSSRSSAVGPMPHSTPPGGQRHPLVAERHLGQRHPSFTSPTRFSAGMRTSVKNTSLNVCPPVISMIGRISMPGRVHRADEVRDALVLGTSGSVRAIRMPNLAYWAPRRPDLLAVDHPLVAVAHRAGAEVGQVAAGAGLAEELAPDLLAREQGEQVALLLLLGAGVQDRGPAQPMPIGFDGAHAGPAQLVVDDQLVDRVGVEAPRLAGQCGAT